MNFDEITIDQLRASGSLKWSAFPDQIGMFVAEMDLGLAEPVRDVIHRFADSPGIGYRSDADREALQAATAQWLGSVSSFSPDPDSVYAVPDVVSSARFVIEALTTPDSPVLLPTPAYMGFTHLIPAMGREMIEVPCHSGGRYELDLEGIRAGFAAGAEALLLVNPANPTGRVYTRAELEALSQVVAKFPQAIVFADDIHAPFVLDGDYVPYASVNDAAARHTVMAVAASKGWNIPGLKCAQLIITNPDLVARLGAHLDWAAATTSTLGAAATIAAYREGGPWQEEVLSYLRGNRDLMEAAVARWPGVEMPHMEGTYIGWLDFTGAVEAGIVTRPVDVWLQEHAGVATTPGSSCGAGYDNFVRVILATPRPVLEQAIAGIETALGA